MQPSFSERLHALEDRPRSAALFAFIVNLVLFGAFLSVASICYESNDDLAMMMIVNGVQEGTPSEFLIFSSILLGYVLKWLYQLSNGVSWYTLYILATHIVAMTAILLSFLRQRASRESLCAFLLLFLFFETPLLLKLQFTSTAILAGASGLFLLLYGNPPHRRSSRLVCALGTGLVVLAALIRVQSLLVSLILLLPAIVLKLAHGNVRRIVQSLGLAFVLAAGSVAFGSWLFARDDGWRTFQEYNIVRGKLIDFPQLEYAENAKYFFNRLGWSRNDYNMFRMWFFADTELYSMEKLSNLLERFESGGAGRNTSDRYLELYIGHVDGLFLLVFGVILLSLAAGSGNRLQLLALAVAELAVITALGLYMAEFAKLVHRVMLPLAIVFSTLLLLTVAEGRWRYDVSHTDFEPAGRWNHSLRFAAGLLVILGFAWSAYRATLTLVVWNDINRINHAAFRTIIPRLITDLRTQSPNPVLVQWGATFPFYWSSPFSDYREIRSLPIIGLGWNQHNPIYNELLRRHSIDNMYRALYLDPNVHLLCTALNAAPYLKFVREHFGDTVQFRPSKYYLFAHSSTGLHDGDTLNRSRLMQISRPALETTFETAIPPAGPAARTKP